MKKVIGFIIITIVLALLGYLFFHISTKVEANTKANLHIESLPNFNLLRIDSSYFSNEQLSKESKTALLFFNSECDFCKNEAESILSTIEKFHNTQLLFVSDQSMNDIREFATIHKLNQQSNITFLHDFNSLFSTQMGIQSIPTTLIYNKQQKLIKKHVGQITASGILKIINKH
ncbi:redoxin domain-containing protein [Kordia sp.]|uniref:TlpA family protein disulfide reductase n=1 Tax=Kordia sp. TaxID=1965332 RepID=UPI0025BB480E|nr:redoxin domain-containing protein [Kordia sp.]MCH2197052.1 redoxin domain-containing protein [Kordia sp.]